MKNWFGAGPAFSSDQADKEESQGCKPRNAEKLISGSHIRFVGTTQGSILIGISAGKSACPEIRSFCPRNSTVRDNCGNPPAESEPMGMLLFSSAASTFSSN